MQIFSAHSIQAVKNVWQAKIWVCIWAATKCDCQFTGMVFGPHLTALDIMGDLVVCAIAAAGTSRVEESMAADMEQPKTEQAKAEVVQKCMDKMKNGFLN